jgi:phosphomevalonate kinase
MSEARITQVGNPVVAAPGKIFMVGEYAVLDGGTAVLAAVSRYAVAQYVTGAQAESVVVEQAMAHVLREVGEAATAIPSGAVLVDSDEFSRGHTKLGLGSSAAVAVATAAAMFEAVGHAIEGQQDLLFRVADAAHRAAQGGVGSGADVAAAVYGGFLKFSRSADGKGNIAPLPMPNNLHLVVFWTEKPASTRSFVEAVQNYARVAPSSYKMLIGAMRATADRFVNELQAGRATAAVAAAGRYGRQMADLGKAVGIPIYTEAFERAAALAHEVGGEAKPSGAGGGDIGVAMFATPEAASLFARACQPPITVLDISLARAGVHRRTSEAPSAPLREPFHAR